MRMGSQGTYMVCQLCWYCTSDTGMGTPTRFLSSNPSSSDLPLGTPQKTHLVQWKARRFVLLGVRAAEYLRSHCNVCVRLLFENM